MECQQITIINISLVLCRYNSVKMSKYNHRMVEIYDGLKTKTWITLPMLLFEHCLSAQCIVVDIVPLTPNVLQGRLWLHSMTHVWSRSLGANPNPRWQHSLWKETGCPEKTHDFRIMRQSLLLVDDCVTKRGPYILCCFTSSNGRRFYACHW
jgi:hypothetical protein